MLGTKFKWETKQEKKWNEAKKNMNYSIYYIRHTNTIYRNENHSDFKLIIIIYVEWRKLIAIDWRRHEYIFSNFTAVASPLSSMWKLIRLVNVIKHRYWLTYYIIIIRITHLCSLERADHIKYNINSYTQPISNQIRILTIV